MPQQVRKHAKGHELLTIIGIGVQLRTWITHRRDVWVHLQVVVGGIVHQKLEVMSWWVICFRVIRDNHFLWKLMVFLL